MKKPISQKVDSFILGVIGRLQARKSKVDYVKNPPCILCYHSISNDKWGFSLSPKDFERQIELILQTRKIVSLKEMVNTDRDSLVNKIAITFDDGYEDIYKKALPILKKFGIRAAVFVIGDSKLVNRVQIGNDKKLLTDNQIRKLRDGGWEVGFHSKTHRNLKNLSEDNLREEIIQGKKDLEKRLGFELMFFSYPNGHYSPKILKIVKEAGFKAAFTINGGQVKKEQSPFKFSRVIIGKDTTLKEYGTLISSAGLYFKAFTEMILRIKNHQLLSFY